jgi:hypothetical protein
MNIQINNPELINWIESLNGTPLDISNQIETALNIGRLSLEQCRLNPNFDLIHKPLDNFTRQMQEKIDSSLKHHYELTKITNDQVGDDLKIVRQHFNDFLQISGSSNRKGKLVEALEYNILQQYFPNYIINNISNSGHEADLHITTDFGKILIELKTYTNSVGKDQVQKFYNDINRIGYPMALFVSNTSGIYGRKKVDWEFYGPNNTVVVFISNGGIDGSGLILGLFFLEAIKRLQTTDSNKYNLEMHIETLVQNVEQAKGQIENVSRVRGDLKILKDSVCNKIDEMTDNVFNIELSLKKTLNTIINDSQTILDNPIVEMPISDIENWLSEKKEPKITALFHELNDNYTLNFSVSNNELIIMNSDNKIIAQTKKARAKKDYEIHFHYDDNILGMTCLSRNESIERGKIILHDLNEIHIIRQRIGHLIL